MQSVLLDSVSYTEESTNIVRLAKNINYHGNKYFNFSISSTRIGDIITEHISLKTIRIQLFNTAYEKEKMLLALEVTGNDLYPIHNSNRTK